MPTLAAAVTTNLSAIVSCGAERDQPPRAQAPRTTRERAGYAVGANRRGPGTIPHVAGRRCGRGSQITASRAGQLWAILANSDRGLPSISATRLADNGPCAFLAPAARNDCDPSPAPASKTCAFRWPYLRHTIKRARGGGLTSAVPADWATDDGSIFLDGCDLGADCWPRNFCFILATFAQQQ